MRYIIGIDGGGTKTEIVVCTPDGNMVAKNIGPSSNPNDIGKENMFKVLVQLIELSVPKDCDCADIGLGISGIFVANCEDYLCARLKERFPFLSNVQAYSDKDSAFNCAYDNDGCIVIIGTGSVGVVKKQGVEKTIGGGGYLIDDALSGFDLGREVINAVLCASDGIGDKTVLSELFYERTKEDVRRHLKVVYQKGKAYIASFAPLIFDAIERGDMVAENAMRKCIFGLERLCFAVYKAWGEEKCDITLFGGLTNKFSAIERFLSEDIKQKITFKNPKYPIVYGLMKGFTKDENFAHTFYGDYLKSNM